MRLASFAVPVSVVVGISPEEQVVGAHAAGSVAGVENVLPRRDRPEVHLPGKAIGADIRSVSDDLAVAVQGGAARPEPAAFRLLNLRPEPLNDVAAVAGGVEPT